MKQTISIIFSLISLVVFGQDYPRIDTVNYGKNVSHVNHYFHYDDKEEKLTESYWFNESGKHYLTYTGYEYERQTKIVFKYNNLGVLLNVMTLRYTSPHNDSISNKFHEAYGESYRSGKHDDNTYKELHKKYSSMYEIINPEEIKWNSENKQPRLIIKKNIHGLDSIMELYDDYDEEERYLDERVLFYYNRKNKLVKKKWIDIENSNVFEFQAFKPSSSELDDSIRVYTGIFQEKTYKYFKDSTKITYYHNGQLSGFETKKYSNNGLILEDLVFNTRKDTLSYFRNIYNSKKQLISRQRVIHTGYNGFGYAMDLVWGDTKKYKYDSSGRLIRIDGYEGDKHISVDRFEIVEK